MALSQVSRTGNPAAAWKYFTKAYTLGRSYELNAFRVNIVAVAGMSGKFAWSGFNDMRHSFAPVVSREPERIGCCCGLYTTTTSFVNSKRQSASQILPIPNNVNLNDGITWPVLGKVAESRELG